MIAEIKELTISAPHAYIPPRPAVKSKQPHSMPSHNKTGCMAVRGGKEEPDGGIRRPTCERGGMLWGVYVCLPVLERGICWAGAPCALSACRHSWPGGRFLTPIYGRQRYIFFRFLPNLSPLFCILAGNFNWFASFSQSGLSHFPAQYNTCQFSLPIDNLCFSKIIT